MTYADLQTAVINYFKRGDISGRVPVWIEFAEAYLFRELAIKSTATSAQVTTTGGLITLPTDFHDVVRLTTSVNGIEYNLDYVTAPDDYTQTGQQPKYYTIEGETFRVFPDAGDGTSFKLYYLPEIGNLSGSLTTNWLLENAEDLYLYSTALQGAVEMKNAGETEKLRAIVAELLDSVRRYAERAGQPMSGRLQVKPRREFCT